MIKRMQSKDPIIRASFAALRRAARRARKLAEATGTPFYILQDGKVVNLNPRSRKRRPAAKARK